MTDWLDSLKSHGIHAIDGRLITDASEFGYAGVPDGWDWSDMGNYYGVGASGSMQQIPYGSMTFRIAFPCGPENVESLIKYALEQVETIKSGEILEEDLNKIKESYLVNYKEKQGDVRHAFLYLEGSFYSFWLRLSLATVCVMHDACIKCFADLLSG